MRAISKLTVAIGVLVSGAALGQTVVNVPAGTGPIPVPESGNGAGAIVTVWNGTQSLTRYLNLQVDDLSVADLTPAGGLVLNFENLDLSSFGGAANLQYSVLAGNFEQIGDPSPWRSMFTGALNQAPIASDSAGMFNALGNFQNFIAATNQACGSATTCIAPSASGNYFGNFDDAMFANMPFSAAGAVGSALSFWTLSAQDAIVIGDPATLSRYSAGATLGQWLLTGGGALSYSFLPQTVVPLPAAAWLLLSGLAGIGAVARRRKTA